MLQWMLVDDDFKVDLDTLQAFSRFNFSLAGVTLFKESRLASQNQRVLKNRNAALALLWLIEEPLVAEIERRMALVFCHAQRKHIWQLIACPAERRDSVIDLLLARADAVYLIVIFAIFRVRIGRYSLRSTDLVRHTA